MVISFKTYFLHSSCLANTTHSSHFRWHLIALGSLLLQGLILPCVFIAPRCHLPFCSYNNTIIVVLSSSFKDEETGNSYSYELNNYYVSGCILCALHEFYHHLITSLWNTSITHDLNRWWSWDSEMASNFPKFIQAMSLGANIWMQVWLQSHGL